MLLVARRQRIRQNLGYAEVKVDAEVARRILVELAEAGCGTYRVATLTGLSRIVLDRINNGQTKMVRPGTLKALREIQPQPAKVPARATQLRIWSAAVRGYGQQDLAELMGRKHAMDLWERIYVARAQEVIDAVMSLPAEGGNPRTAKIAQRRGWLPMEAYDRDTFTNVYWDGVGGLLAQEPYTREEAIAEVHFLMAGGTSIEAALTAVGRSPDWWKHVQHAQARQALRVRERESLECAS